MQAKRSKKIPILLFVILLELIAIVVLLSRFYYVFAYNDLEVKSYESVQLKFKPMNYTISKAEAKQLLSNLFAIQHTYIETNDIAETDFANSNIVRKEIKIRPNLDLVEYVISYTHELVHIKYELYDETNTAYKTFVELYESGHEELQNISLVYAQSVLDGCYKGTEYDCGYYILEFLVDVNFPMNELTIDNN